MAIPVCKPSSGALPPANVGVCGSCMDAGALQDRELVEGTHRGTLEQLADWSE